MTGLKKTFESDDEHDPVLQERYQRLRYELENGDQIDLLVRLRSPSLFEDSGDSWEHDIGERYRQYQQQKDKPGFIINNDEDFAELEAKYRKPDNGNKNR